MVAAASISTACGGAEGEPVTGWTVPQAESITTLRGMHVRVRECRGIGSVRHEDSAARFARFACVAGARRPAEKFDTVGVLYELRPLGAYQGPTTSKHVLEHVRFIGGPGIP